MADEIEFKDKAGRRWSIPMPPEVQIKIQCHDALDQLTAALAQLKNAIEGCSVACDAMAVEPDVDKVHDKWFFFMTLLKSRLEPVGKASQALAPVVLKLLLD